MNLNFHRSIRAPRGFPELISFDVGPAQDAITTWATAEGKAALTGRSCGGPHAPSFPETMAAIPTDVAVVEHLENGDRQTILRQIGTTFIRVQSLLDGFLVVGSRCRWTPGHVDKNALRYDQSGQFVQEATFGDGIAHVGTTPDGLTWVGYFDEGILGNFGWGGLGPEPIGSAGINCFDASLTCRLQNADSDITDCYAMTVVGSSVYACCYADWRIRMLGPTGEQASWSNSIVGATIIVVADSVAALIGGYNERDRIVIGALNHGRFEVATTARVTVSGNALDTSVAIVARENILHALVGHSWYKSELSNEL